MTAPVLATEDAHQVYTVGAGFMKTKRQLAAVRGVSLALERGTVTGLVGESGCGKSTLSRLLLGLEAPSAGNILFDGKPLSGFSRREITRRIQPVFQDPYAALNPRKSIGSIIALPLIVHGLASARTARKSVEEIMDVVGLPSRFYNRYPNQLSGGQRQRVAIARALIIKPDVLICDEPTSALDVSVQAQVLNLLQDLQKELSLTYLLISHDLAVVQHMATRMAVMYLGRIVEEADARTLFSTPRHPYTRALLESVLTPEPGLGLPETHLGGSFPNPLNIPGGCSFHPRCPEFMAGVCDRVVPPEIEKPEGRVECHLYAEQSVARFRSASAVGPKKPENDSEKPVEQVANE
jgi:peptide/nickel transport system ATP-binding protein